MGRYRRGAPPSTSTTVNYAGGVRGGRLFDELAGAGKRIRRRFARESLQQRAQEHWPGVAAAATTLLLGLWRLDMATPHYDEPIYVSTGRRYLDGDLNHLLDHPPFATYAFGVAQMLFGDGIPSARLVSLAAGVATTFLVWLLVSRLVGRVVAGFAALTWACLPQSLSAGEVATIIERPETLALLESMTTMFMVAAVWAGTRALSDERWRWMVAVGAFVGFATATKVTGLLAGPPICLALCCFRRSRLVWYQTLVAGAVSLVVFAATYAPYGRAANEAVMRLWDSHWERMDTGHRQFVAGAVYNDPPWWTPLWHHLDADGLLLSAVLVGLVLLSMPRWRRPEAALVVAVAAVVVAALCLSPYQLRHYRLVALPFLFVLATVGAQVLWTRRDRVSRAAAVAAFAVVGWFAADAVADRLVLQPAGYAAVGEVLEEAGLGERQVYVFGSPHLLQHYLGDRVVAGAYGSPIPADAAVVTEQNWELRFPAQRDGLVVTGPEGEQSSLEQARDSRPLGPVTLWLPQLSNDEAINSSS